MELTITRPDDWHLHVRDGAVLETFLAHTARAFARAIIMPNLRPPVTRTAQALAYRQRILAAAPAHGGFQPLMTLYLTDRTTPDEIATAKASGYIFGAKLYPAGATTNSDNGVTDIPSLHPVLETMAEVGLTLQVHAEVTDRNVDIFDRERVFLEQILGPLVDRHPRLKVVVEHITTREAVDFVLSAPPSVAATITAHHLLYSRNALFSGGLRPHYYCLPILKRERHRAALLEAISGGSSKFFLGTDSAPHPRRAKESDCGCAGIYTAHAALELYAEAFEEAAALDRLEAFASFNGADFYGLPRNRETITLQRRPWQIPECYPLGDDILRPLRAGERTNWRLAEAQ